MYVDINEHFDEGSPRAMESMEAGQNILKWFVIIKSYSTLKKSFSIIVLMNGMFEIEL